MRPLRTTDVTVRTVGFVQAGFVRGRGPIVWVVVAYGQGDQESKVHFRLSFELSIELVCNSSLFRNSRGVLATSRVKGDYDMVNGSSCDNVGKIETWEDVLVSGQQDTADRFIRQGLDDSTGPGKRGVYQRPESVDNL